MAIQASCTSSLSLKNLKLLANSGKFRLSPGSKKLNSNYFQISEVTFKLRCDKLDEYSILQLLYN